MAGRICGWRGNGGGFVAWLRAGGWLEGGVAGGGCGLMAGGLRGVANLN